MLISRQSLTYGFGLVVLSLVPACASSLPSPQADLRANQVLSFSVPAAERCDSVSGPAAGADAKCEAGDAAACFDASVRYMCGAGVARDEQKAAARAQQACEGGHTPSCANAGALALRAASSEAALAAGVQALRSGCVAGDGDACNNLAIAMSEGLGVPEDTSGALFMFGKLCDRGNLTSCRNAATVREVFLHEAKLPEGARPWPRVAAR
jgi:TPR repeat protein